MSNLPDTTVIVPVYNGERTIGECIASLLALDFPADCHEVIVVDNHSTDSTTAIVRQFAPRVRLLSEHARGASAARNCGIRAARGTVIALTDADCAVAGDWLRRIVEPLSEPRIGIAGGRILAHRPCNRIAAFGERIHDHARAIAEWTPGYVITMNWAARRTVLDEVGLFDVTLLRGQDVDLAWRVWQRGYRLAYAPEALVYHRNETTLAGLFREGYTHGYHSLRLHGKHRTFLMANAARSRRRWLGRLYALWAAREPDVILSATFGAGKRLGKLVGSLRRE